MGKVGNRMDFTTFDIGDLAALVGVAAGGIGVWVALNGRLVKVEAQQVAQKERMDAEKVSIDRRFVEAGETRKEQFNQIMDTLANIDRKLDNKADKKPSGL